MKRTIEIEIEIETADDGTMTLTLPGFTKTIPVEKEPQPEPWARWRATADGDGFWKVSTSGKAQEDAECFIREDNESYNFGNYFRTQELAERHAKRLRSMVPTCAMPKADETVWIIGVGLYGMEVSHHTIPSTDLYGSLWLYFQGRFHATKEAAKAWIAEFGDVWTTRVDGEGE